MIEAVKVFFLALVQGIGEFLPISSSGHLLVLGKMLFGENGLDEGEFLTLGILLHAGTLLSILIVFRRDIIKMLCSDWRLIGLLITASIPTAIIGFTIEKYCTSLVENLTVTGFGFLATAALLLFVMRPKGNVTNNDHNENTEGKSLAALTFTDALIIGLFQGIAVLPGFSRSGFTIASAIWCGAKRRDAAVFSFLLAIPAIGGVALLETVNLIQEPGSTLDSRMALWLMAAVFSCLVGIVSLVWLLKWLQAGTLHRFAWWLIPLGVAVLIVQIFYK